MSFLQPWMLAALPLIALPIIIHLINQRRFQTIHWAAMMFLLAAHKMARGYSRIRQWLILAARTMAVAGLVFAISRPLASGWVGLAAGGRADTTIILLDRSPSMQQRGGGTGASKLETGRQQLVQALGKLGSGRYVLIDSATNVPHEIESPDALLKLPHAGPASAPADLPQLLQSAHDYIRNNRTGRTEIWICSDLRENDWTAESGRWSSLRDVFLELPQGVRFYLLAYPQAPANNVAVRVTRVRRQVVTDGAELLVSVRLTRQGHTEDAVKIPLQFEIEGARSVVTVDLSGEQTDIQDHRIPIERNRERGWGRVSIPADSNPADDDFYFVFDHPPPRKTIIVAEDPQAERPLQLAASISPEIGVECLTDVLLPDQMSNIAWDDLALLIWQAPLPTGALAEQMEAFVDRGRQVVLLPPRNPTADEFFDARWLTWESANDPIPIETWRGDEDLLARTLNGAALPVGQLEIRQYCRLKGDFTPLAKLRGGDVLVGRVPTKRGGLYFWATTPAPKDSSLATGGVVLYAFVQRALASGAAVLGRVRQIDAGSDLGEGTTGWQRLTESNGLSTEITAHRGVTSAGEQLYAINRPLAEDNARILSDSRVADLFRGLPYVRVDDQAGSIQSLIEEIWRAFLMSMLLALVVEAVLCLPKLAPIPANAASARAGAAA